VTLRKRIAAASGLAVALTVVGLAIGGYEATSSTLRGQIDSALNDRAKPFLQPDHDGGGPGGPGQHGGGGPGPFQDQNPTVPFGGAAGSVQFVSPTGRASRPPDEPWPVPVTKGTKEIAASGTGREFSDVTVKGVHLRMLTVGVGDQGAVQIVRPLTEVDRALRHLLEVLAIAGAAGIALAAMLGAVVARTALAPISRFTRRTEAITANPTLAQRLDASGKDELARLARSFNATLDALEASVEAQRHLVADASHELRTPMASLRANVQVLEEADRLPPEEREALRADIISELDELTALVSDIVELARGSKPIEVADDVRLDDVVGELVARAERRAAGSVEFRSELEPTVVRGEPERIARAVSNLLDNARKWSPERGVVEVSLRDGIVSIRDHGPGFAEEDLPFVFDRFYRAAKSRGLPGSGLGLAIVRQAAESHGGTAEAANAPGGGAIVRVSFGAHQTPVEEPEPAGAA
jgi:two-component system sensor histidine kinase MprB